MMGCQGDFVVCAPCAWVGSGAAQLARVPMTHRRAGRATRCAAEQTTLHRGIRMCLQRARSIVVKGTKMGWVNTFRSSGAGAADPWNETVITGPPYDARQATRRVAENPAAPVDRPDAPIAEEIKRQQISLAVRYVAALRAR